MINFGWVDNPEARDATIATMRRPMIGDLPPLTENKNMFLYEIVRKVKGSDLSPGPQGIGDCVSWAYAGLVDVIQCVQIFNALKATGLLGADDSDPQVLAQTSQFEETATEPIYALSRVEYGNLDGSYDDGSVGAWAAAAIEKGGTLSRPALKRLGLQPNYDKNRAKEWGARGLPDNLEPSARQHRVKRVSQATSFEQAAALIQNGYPVAVCSNQGFTMTRDADGFCRPQGTWMHAMLFDSVRWDRPGLLCRQQWGVNTPDGPLAFNQPNNTFWVDAQPADRMLSQKDSFTGSQFEEYEAQDLVTWSH
jgi:hypothetical protein